MSSRRGLLDRPDAPDLRDRKRSLTVSGFGRWVRFRWSSHIRPLLRLAVVLLAAHYVLTLVDSGPVAGETIEDVEAASATIGWTPAIESHHLAEDIERRVNEERIARGLRPLVWHEGLADLARQWTEEMMVTGYRHSPDSFRSLPDLHGIGENILMGSSDSGQAHVGWMRSDGHRQNLLTPEYTAIGIGVVCRSDGRIWATQMFGMPRDVYPSSDVSMPPVEPIVREDSGLSC
jgi:hypothetical protein